MEVDPLPQRQSEDVYSAAKIAGIPLSGNKPIQLLQFGPTPSTEDIKLLQLTNEVTGALKSGQRVVIKGDQNDDAVLCTEDSTYEMRLCETSNTLLLCPNLLCPSDTEFKNASDGSIRNTEVVGCASNILELRKCRPKLERLKELLMECPYRGVLEEQVRDEEEQLGKPQAGKKYTLSNLLDIVQASESEIIEGLRELRACLINGHWRILDIDYQDELVQQVLTLLEEQDWSWRRVPLGPCCEKLSELHPPFIIKHCLECYGVQTEQKDVYELIEGRVCQLYAEILLRPAGRFNYSEFMECWQEAVPQGMKTDLAQLKGLALTDMNSMPPVIWHYPVENLPKEPAERFAELFRVREKWSFDDIEPYVKDLQTPSVTLNALLLKYSRVSTNAKGTKLYNAKTTAL